MSGNPLITRNNMKQFLLLFVLLISQLANANYKAEFPLSPEYALTPGSLCDRPDSYRYPERIPYCEREVHPELKDYIFQYYRNAGYRLILKPRSDYKIDHLIPLCAGGSNGINNLWPQHRSIFERTDVLESLGCQKLKEGRIRQRDLINLILSAKFDLRLVPQVLRTLQNL